MAISSPWAQDLQQASFGGIPFVVDRTEATLGRRIVPHVYPFRDLPYFEDMGASPKVYTFEAYLIGDKVHQNRKDFEAVLNIPGKKTLVHPTRGTMMAMLQTASFLETKEEGRKIKCRLTFAVADDKASPALYPKTTPNTNGTTRIASLNLGASAVLDFLHDITSAIAYGLGVVRATINAILAPIQYVIHAVLSTVSSFIGLVKGTVGAVLGIIGAVRGIASIFTGLGITFGRFNAGQIGIPSSVLASIDQTLPLAGRLNATTTALLSAAVTNTTAIADAAASAIAMEPTTSDFATSVQALVEQMRLNINDPNDQITTLVGLAQFPAPVSSVGSSPIAMALQGATATSASFCRRAALVSLANATADYAPTSSTEAQEIIDLIAPLFDAEIEYAADNDDLGSYSQLRATRTSVIQDLQTRGSQLPPLVTYSFAANLPSLPLAYRLYQDATRADQLIAQVNPINPAFFPQSFVALGS